MRLLGAHYAPPYGFNPFGCEIDGPHAHYAPTMRLKCLGVKSVGPRCAHYGAHDAPPIGLTWLGAKSMGPRCGHYAPTRRSLCAHYVSKAFGAEIGGPTVRPPPTLHPLLAIGNWFTPLGLNRWAHDAATMRLLGAHYAPTMHLKGWGVKSVGQRHAHYAPTRRPLCAPYWFKPLGA